MDEARPDSTAFSNDGVATTAPRDTGVPRASPPQSTAAQTRLRSLNEFQSVGFAVIPSELLASAIDEAHAKIDRLVAANAPGNRDFLARDSVVYAVRHLERWLPDCVSLIGDTTRDLVSELLGAQPRIVSVKLFDKPPGVSWALPWHRDLVVQFSNERRRVQRSELERMVAVRVHLDVTTAENGALEVIEASHRDSDLDAGIGDRSTTLIPAAAGETLVISPLVLHRSSRGHDIRRRRVVHFDLAAADDR